MDWAANYYEGKLDAKADPESYDPLAVVEHHLGSVLRMNRILSALRTEDHPESSMPVVRHLRTAYWQTFLAYKAHDGKFHRQWDVPDWIDPLAIEPAKTPAKMWSIEDWLSNERHDGQALFSTQLTVFRALTDGMRRSVRRIYNTTATLYVYECERINWAMDPERK